MKHIINGNTQPIIPALASRVMHHQENGIFEWNPEKIKLHWAKDFWGDKFRNSSVKIADLNKEFVGLSVLNANALDYLLAHPEIIPEEWKDDGYGDVLHIFFWGTIYDSNFYRDILVRTLFWDGNQWEESEERLLNIKTPHVLIKI